MRMDTEDQVTKKNLDGLVANSKLEEEADIILSGDLDNGYDIIKPEGGYKGITKVDNPYKFASENSNQKVLVKHSDGSFDRYNHRI